MKIVILGWDSLVWKPDTLSEHLKGGFWSKRKFELKGPMLPVEFSRKGGGLTAVVDKDNGVNVPTWVAISNRPDLRDAVTDLWIREKRFAGQPDKVTKEQQEDGTIGYACKNAADEASNSFRKHGHHQFARDLILEWLNTTKYDAAVWTALQPSTFEDKDGDHAFSVDRAVEYLRGLRPQEREQALLEIETAPEEVETPLRSRLRELNLRRLRKPNDTIGDDNVKEALGFLKDWVTAITAIETTAIGVIAAFFQFNEGRSLSYCDRFLLIAAVVCFFISLYGGCQLLYMLPGCIQRQPYHRIDIYWLRTVSFPVSFWAKWFWWTFFWGIFFFALFCGSRIIFSPGPQPRFYFADV